jgi:hypothetical protein
LRIQWASNSVKSTINKPNEILVAFIEVALPERMQRQPGWLSHLLAEKPKVGELQMDWLRSEDLKEEKNVTAPIAIVAFRALCRLRSGETLVVHYRRGVPLGMQRMSPEHLDADHFSRYDARLRQEPEEDDSEEEEEDDGKEDDDGTQNDDGYSE